GPQAGAQDVEGQVVVVTRARDQGVGEGVTQVHVGGGQVADRSEERRVGREGGVGEGDVGGRLVDVGHRERELLFGRQAAGVGGADAVLVSVVCIRVLVRGGPQAGAQDVEGQVVVVTRARDQGVGEGVTQVHVGGGQVAD